MRVSQAHLTHMKPSCSAVVRCLLNSQSPQVIKARLLSLAFPAKVVLNFLLEPVFLDSFLSRPVAERPVAVTPYRR